MRIIAGVAGGRRLKAPDGKDTRPATDRVREAVFSSLGDAVVGADVVDLYAGSGSFGLEALSRGAGSAVFVENGTAAIRALSDNIQTLGIGGELRRGTVGQFLQANTNMFDLAFIDPPWPMATDEMERDFSLLDRSLRVGGLVLASRRHTDRVPDVRENWRVAAEKRYGDTRILKYRKETEEE
jgi:16S rRNA (guanine966-N2)-methyltransferase